ncbi:MAG: hypothetical protein R3D44_16165 [Hyphomicrobiaceae bacterium]
MQKLRRSLVILAGVCLAASGVNVIAPASAREPSPPRTKAARKVAHGSALTAADVGPAAAGLAPKTLHPGGEMHDGRPVPFARRIERSALYDGFRVAGPHLLIEQMHFYGPLDVYVTVPVVLRGVEIRPRKAADWALHTRPGAGPVYVLWSEMAAASTTGAPSSRAHALSRALYLRSENVTVYRSHLTLAADGIQIHAPGARVVETLIDRLVYWAGDHNDGIQMLGKGADAQIVRSRIDNPNPQTSALNLIGDRVLIENCYLSGGGWTLYGGAHHTRRVPGSTRGVVIRGNVFGRDHFPKGGNFGPVTGYDTVGPGNAWSSNRWSDGTPLVIGGPPAPRPR